MFPCWMAVLGFAFNQDSFQAIGDGRLRQFTVPPAPFDTLDSILAAAQLPLIALDLRSAPGSGPVAAWLRSKPKSRSIGATYSGSGAEGYYAEFNPAECFDALLFVESTTSARKN